MTHPTLARWQALVDPDGGPALQRLVQQTLDGLAIDPLHVEGPRHRLPLPGRTEDPQNVGWVLWDADAPAALRQHGQGGIQSLLWVQTPGAPDTLPDAELDRAVQAWVETGVPLSAWLPPDTAARLRAAIARVPTPVPGWSLTLQQEPADEVWSEGPGVCTWNWHHAGALDTTELAVALCRAAHAIDEAAARGPDAVRAWADTTWVRVPVDMDLPLQVARLRALRLGIGRLTELAMGEALPVRVQAVTSPRAYAALDAWNNMVRGSVQTVAAVVGTADAVAVAPWDVTLPAQADPAALRAARNTAWVVLLESWIPSHRDAAFGSYSLETLTATLLERAWALVQEVALAGGGSSEAGRRVLLHALARDAAALERGVATRRRALVGATEFPHPDDPAVGMTGPRTPWPGLDAAWWTLRTRMAEAPVEALQVGLLVWGDATDPALRARVGWVRTTLQTAGRRPVTVPDHDAPPAAGVVVCARDADWEDPALLDRVRALAREGGLVVLAGRAAEGAPIRAAGARTLMYAGADLVALFSAWNPALTPVST
jgi:hypothetical protein